MGYQTTNTESNRVNHPSRRIWRRLLFVILFLGLAYLLIVVITQAGQSGTLVIPIVLVNSPSPGLSAATIDVSYDPTLIQVSGCRVVAPELRAGDCYRNTAVNGTNSQLRRRTIHSEGINITNGQVRFSLITNVPITQSGTSLAELTVRPVAQHTTTVTLSVNVRVATEERGEPLPVEIEAGAIPLASMPRGDVNCDGKADRTDVREILAYDVGRAQASTNCPPPRATIYVAQCDRNGDDLCDSSDALLIPAQQ